MKDFKNPFNLYDIFGYLIPGMFLFVLFVVEYDSVTIINYYKTNCSSLAGIEKANLNWKTDYFLDFFSYTEKGGFNFASFTVFIFVCYIMGHIVSAFSSLILERIALKWFKIYNPQENLLSPKIEKENSYRRRIWRWFIRSYIKAFDPDFRSNFITKVNKRFGYQVEISDYYWLCYADIINLLPASYRRIQHFVNLYGFNRNCSGAIVIYIIIRLAFIRLIVGSPLYYLNVWILVVFLLISLALYFNFLKLYKRQTVDVFYMYYTFLQEVPDEAKSRLSYSKSESSEA